jgi:hypothetical protein
MPDELIVDHRSSLAVGDRKASFRIGGHHEEAAAGYLFGGGARPSDQPGGWLGATEKLDWPILTNLRLDPYERTGMFNGKDNGSIAYYNWFAIEFWRFVLAQQVVSKAAQTLIPANAVGRQLQHDCREGADR